MMKRLRRAYARRGKLPWCRQTLRKLDGGLVRAAEHYFKSRSVADLIRMVGGKQAKEWIVFRPRNFRGKQADRRGPVAFDDAVDLFRRAYAAGSKRSPVREHWLGYEYLINFEPGANATAHWLHRIGRLQEALKASGLEVAAAWFYKRRKHQPALDQLWWLNEDPRVVAAKRDLIKLGVPLSEPASRSAEPAPHPAPKFLMAPQPEFGSLGGKKRPPETSSILSEWEDDDDRPRRGPIGLIDDALEALGAAFGEDTLARLVR